MKPGIFRLKIYDGDDLVEDSGWQITKVSRLPDLDDPLSGGSILVREDDGSVSISRWVFPED